MKKHGRQMRVMALASLVPPPGWESGIDAAVVATIAESLRSEGLREPIVIVASGHIVHGVHRWAAAKAAGLAEVECVIEARSATNEAHEARVIAENLARRHLGEAEQNELRAALVTARQPTTTPAGEHPKNAADAKKAKSKNLNEIPERARARSVESKPIRDVSPTGAGRLSGREPSPHGAVVAEVARETGTTAGALRDAVRRREKKTAPTDAAPTPVDAAGVPIPENYRAAWVLVAEQIKAADTHLRQALASLHQITGCESAPVELGEFQRLAATIKSAGYDLRKAAPAYLCTCCGSGSCRWGGGRGVLTSAAHEYRPRMEAQR